MFANSHTWYRYIAIYMGSIKNYGSGLLRKVKRQKQLRSSVRRIVLLGDSLVNDTRQ